MKALTDDISHGVAAGSEQHHPDLAPIVGIAAAPHEAARLQPIHEADNTVVL